MNRFKLNDATTSDESDPHNPPSETETGNGRAVEERRWPWSIGHFDWMDEYCPMPVEVNGGDTPILAHTWL
ncbi:hypothetical protein [Paraburkholderia rhizosphaerae]|uniref:Uncharacterized protein n=1 Tax=Paraburkholderia rhizosphaerae TaxID=480658 RepID=A0A4R8LJG9_9BURK|nr:hypothetical protein [Paraburkholderia rhizosphaerae]TDY43955.1 hypothetical protein BX592_117157 [Paraburkholderia rhizosphaerae]